jgi:hypothetical protein
VLVGLLEVEPWAESTKWPRTASVHVNRNSVPSRRGRSVTIVSGNTSNSEKLPWSSTVALADEVKARQTEGTAMAETKRRSVAARRVEQSALSWARARPGRERCAGDVDERALDCVLHEIPFGVRSGLG